LAGRRDDQRNPGAIKVALISSGLGNSSRGFEISTARWYRALRKHTKLDVRLYCGGDYPDGIKLWNIPRNSIWTRPLLYWPFFGERTRWEMTYVIEQFSFWTALNFELLRWKPDVVWLKDVPLAHLVLFARSLFALKFKMVFSNGGGFKPTTYKPFDVVQQIQRQSYQEALNLGTPPEKLELITNCIPAMTSTRNRRDVRLALGLDESDWVVVCVAAWNKYHKRIDYLLEEVARISDPRVKLILCGTPEAETRGLQELGWNLLGDRAKWLTVSDDEVGDILRASDVFVLPSLRECLGNALMEAAMSGLPVATHPHDAARFGIEDDFWMIDLSVPGNLAKRLLWLREHPPEFERLSKLKDDVARRFDEGAQAAKFEKMVLRLLPGAAQTSAPGGSHMDGERTLCSGETQLG